MSIAKSADTFFTPLPPEQAAEIVRPELFTCPFYYDPHPLSMLAAADLQAYLRTQTEWVHNFGLGSEQEGEGLVIGKMFGVLVVENAAGQLGYLAAVSGKLAGSNHHRRLVPPVFDILQTDGFFRQEEALLNELNCQIERLQNNPLLAQHQQALADASAAYQKTLEALKSNIKTQKAARQKAREAATTLGKAEYQALDRQLRQESTQEQYELKNYKRQQQIILAQKQAQVDELLSEIQLIAQERKQRSAALQARLFEQYTFLNLQGKQKSLREIFREAPKPEPPAGAGECAAPKLLQHAYLHGYQLICMAEFWWGQSPSSEIRTHQQFYPACRSKCMPILGHMLKGVKSEANPLLINQAANKSLPIVYEDEHLLLVNKPHEFLSVPGKSVQDSVYTRIREHCPEATGPLIVHRLDMSTSGLLVLAKSLEVYVHLQRQFVKRTIKKRYTAILDGTVEGDEGEINLPLRVDLDDRPRQLVCYEHGKAALTRWKVIDRAPGRTIVHFYPITGRSHQLRMHAAHQQGLGCPIKGDDIYGKRADRLYLHAAFLAFEHPITKEIMRFEVEGFQEE